MLISVIDSRPRISINFASTVNLREGREVILSPNSVSSGLYLSRQSAPNRLLFTLTLSSPLPRLFTFYMPGIRPQAPYICARCLRVSQRHDALHHKSRTASRPFSVLSPLRNSSSPHVNAQEKEQERQSSVDAQVIVQSKEVPKPPCRTVQNESGAMSRRLAEATEDALLTGGRAGRKAVEEAGFSEELKGKLLERLEAHKFRSENASAFAEAEVTSNIGRGSRDIATAPQWTGVEKLEDTVLRLLDDSHKPLKPGLRGSGKVPVDFRLKQEPKIRPGQRLANARDKSSIYAISKDSQMSEKEREDRRKELKDRFTPGARSMPNSVTGLAALANERIEDAIARGQFKV